MTSETAVLDLDILGAEIKCIIEFDYQPYEPASPTSASVFENTGDPGDPEIDEELEITAIRIWHDENLKRHAINLTPLLNYYSDVVIYIHDAVLESIHGGETP